MTEDGLYWCFTSSSQTVAAFVAFLLSGFVFVASLLDDLAGKDETLAEVQAELKAGHYLRFRELSYLTAFAVCCDLLVVLLQALHVSYSRPYLLSVSVAATFACIIAAVFVTLRIIDPKRFEKAAQEILRRRSRRAPSTVVSAGEFLEVFIDIERALREASAEPAPRVAVAFSSTPAFLPLSQSLELLRRSEVLDSRLVDRLRKLISYRNLVAHGHVRDAEESQLWEARALRDEVRKAVAQAPQTGA